MIWLVTFAALWAVCGFFAYGLTYAYFQREYPGTAADRAPDDRGLARTMALAGPAGLVVALSEGRLRHGVKWL